MSDIRTQKQIEIEVVVDGNFCGGFRSKNGTNDCPQLKVTKYYDFDAGLFKKAYLCRLLDHTFEEDLGTRHPRCIELFGILRKSTKKEVKNPEEREETTEEMVSNLVYEVLENGDSEAGWCG